MGYLIYVPVFYIIKAYKYSVLVDHIKKEKKEGNKPVKMKKGSFVLPQYLITSPKMYGIRWTVHLIMRVGIIVFIDWAFSNIVPQLIFQTIGRKENMTMV